MPNAAAVTQKAIAALWKRSLPQIEERLTLLDQAATAAIGGNLGSELRNEAASVAHKLAGSLGMFGFEEGTRLARQIEHLLEAAVVDSEWLESLTQALRKSLPLEEG